MRVLEIRDITKKHLHLHYRNEFQGEAVFEYSKNNSEAIPVEFTIEHSANGGLDISARMLGKLNYPLLPALKSLKEHIRSLEKKGKLI
jgi:hypothetical protein